MNFLVDLIIFFIAEYTIESKVFWCIYVLDKRNKNFYSLEYFVRTLILTNIKVVT